MLMRAARLRGAVHRICRAHGQRVLVNMIAMNMVEMTVVQIIDMAIGTGEPAYGARSWGHVGEYG